MIIWDPKSFEMICRKMPAQVFRPENTFSAMMWDSHNTRLVLANTQIHVWPYRCVESISLLLIYHPSLVPLNTAKPSLPSLEDAIGSNQHASISTCHHVCAALFHLALHESELQ